MKRIIDKYRKEAYDLYVGNTNLLNPPWKLAILEAIFKPKVVVPGKEPLSHLHPDIDKLHLPEDALIADWRKYRVEDHPMLVNHQKRCHAAGLHDPFLRNYAWQLYPNTMVNRTKTRVITMGCGFGFVTALFLYIAERIYDHYYPMEYLHTEEYLKKHHGGDHH